MNELIEVIKNLIDELTIELGEAYARTPATISSWINIRKSYMISLSLSRILENIGKID